MFDADGTVPWSAALTEGGTIFRSCRIVLEERPSNL